MKDQDQPPGSTPIGTSLTLWTLIGIAIGAAVGMATDELALGISFGIAFGIGLWARLRKAAIQEIPEHYPIHSSSQKETL